MRWSFRYAFVSLFITSWPIDLRPHLLQDHAVEGGNVLVWWDMHWNDWVMFRWSFSSSLKAWNWTGTQLKKTFTEKKYIYIRTYLLFFGTWGGALTELPRTWLTLLFNKKTRSILLSSAGSTTKYYNSFIKKTSRYRQAFFVLYSI